MPIFCVNKGAMEKVFIVRCYFYDRLICMYFVICLYLKRYILWRLYLYNFSTIRNDSINIYFFKLSLLSTRYTFLKKKCVNEPRCHGSENFWTSTNRRPVDNKMKRRKKLTSLTFLCMVSLRNKTVARIFSIVRQCKWNLCQENAVEI